MSMISLKTVNIIHCTHAHEELSNLLTNPVMNTRNFFLEYKL